MSYTRRKILEARARVEEIRSRPCPHDDWAWAGIWEWCRRCGMSLREALERGEVQD